jgi:predicted ATP-dependent protease
MLREEVVDAVKEGKFHVYSAKNIDEGIEILTGVPFGERKKDGTYPMNTINRRVDEQLKGMAQRLKQFYGEEKKEEEKK